MPKDKSPASSAPSGEEDGGASPASTSANENSLLEKPKPKRFNPSSSSGKSRLTAERREEIRQQARQKFQNARRPADQPNSTRQLSSCSPCRMRRVRCDLKDLSQGSVGPQPTCSSCKERSLKCVTGFTDVKPVKPHSNNSPSSSSDGGASGSSIRPTSGMHNTAPSNSGGSFFSSASNIGIEGGQFSLDSSSNRNQTNLTINLHHGLPSDGRSVYGEPFDPTISANFSSLPGSTPFSQDYTPYFEYQDYCNLYHISSPYESMGTTGRSFPSTRYIRDGFNPAHPYGGPSDWLSNDWSTLQDRINNSQWAGSGDSSFTDPVGLWGSSQNITTPSLSQSSSSSSASSSEQMVVAEGGRSATQSQDQNQNSELQAQKSSEIYCRHLSVKQRGFPLWIPEPNCYLPIQYQRKGISIGDVGVITAAGSFDYLFNVLLAHDHPFNVGRVPPGFVPLSPPLDPSDIRGQLEFRSNSFIASSSVRRTLGNPDDIGTTFHISASEGAILTIPDGALSEDLGNLVLLRRYMSENVESWYRHANGPRGRELQNGDLRLVIGCDKTTAWGMAAFGNLSQGEDTRLRFKPVGTSQFQTYGWELHSGTAEVRSGPDAREIRVLNASDAERGGQPRPYENQCIFVRTLNATLHDTAWLELMAELSVPSGSAGSISTKDIEMSSTTPESAGGGPASGAGSRFLAQTMSADPHAGNSISSADGANDRVTVHKPEVPAYLTSHPSKSLNAAILQQYMDAKMAITDDSDWSSVLTENDIVMPKPRHLTERVLAHSTPVRDATGVVYLEKNISTSAPAPLSSALADFAFSMPPMTLPPLSDVDDTTLSSRYTTRIVPMRHQSGSPSSM